MTNYAFDTSLPSYKDNASIKRRQADMLFQFIRRGANNLLQLSELMQLPESTVSGRCFDLREEGKIEYRGHVIYKDRKRKRICVIEPKPINLQKELFAV